MFKIHIKEIYPDGQSVAILADGSLDHETIPILLEVCKRHWEAQRKVELHLEGLIRLSREGMDFLQEIQNKVTFVNPPNFIKLTRQEPAGFD